MSAMAIAILGFVSAIVGGLIQAYGTGRFERAKFERQAKWELYSRYFATVARLSFIAPNTDEHLLALSDMAQIRGHIGVIGSTEVINAVGEVFRFPNLLGEDAQEAMATALDAMRRDVGEASARADRT